MKDKMLIWSVVTVLAISILILGCETVGAETTTVGAKEAPTEEFTLHVISHREFSETLMKLLDILDDEFESAHPGVTVQRDFM